MDLIGQKSLIFLTDLYQLTMAYAYWKAGRRNDRAVFDLFFRKSPFSGEFTIFAGLSECIKFLESFHYTESDLDYLRSILPPKVEEEFFGYMRDLDLSEITIYALEEGSIAFPRIPLMRIEGPLIIAQLLETTLLTLVNYASLVTTNAARYRIAAGTKTKLLEFGLRRAQGPDGGLSASRYTYVGGFDGTSNVLAGKLYNIPVKGTHAHAYVTSFNGAADLNGMVISHKDDHTIEEHDFYSKCLAWRKTLAVYLRLMAGEAPEGELAAFAAYAVAFPEGFLALVDTYDVTRSGLLNFAAVAMALNDLGYKSLGIRIDSGDLAYLSKIARETFQSIAQHYDGVQWFKDLMIVASNDINEDTILSLEKQGHEIDCFGIGTHLVTCQKQPALGCVYKLVEIDEKPTIKLSQDVEKVTMPGKKNAYRLYSNDGHALIDLMLRQDEKAPQVNQKVLCRHPFQESKRAWVIPSKVEDLYRLVWAGGKAVEPRPTLVEIRQKVQRSLQTLRQDHKRSLNPTPYKVGVSDRLYTFIHDLWLENQPIGELS